MILNRLLSQQVGGGIAVPSEPRGQILAEIEAKHSPLKGSGLLKRNSGMVSTQSIKTAFQNFLIYLKRNVNTKLLELSK